ncbi:MAG: diacylglycerol kinase family lipid kinase [Thermodesulfovibrionales bacterium]|nr:diacylglycerol kinase family lipid kinase [Thermodesulfovibrionales bacterium]
MFEKIILIGNPIAGGYALRKIYRALRIFEKRGLEPTLFITKEKGNAETLARENRDRPSTLIVVAGGDGTYNEVANGLAGSNTPMAILPVGTTSVLAKELKMPNSITKAIDFVLTGNVQTVHLGKISSIKEPTRKSRFFLLMAGIGFDGEAVFGVNKKIKKYFGKVGYIASGLKVLCSYKPNPLDIIAYDAKVIKKAGSTIIEEKEVNKSIHLKGFFTVVGKSACYGGSFKFTPHAKLTDDTFYIFVAHSRGWFSIIRYFSGMVLQKHLAYKDISYLRAKRVEIWGDSKVQIDGDYAGTTPLRIEVVPDSLKLITKNY